MPPPMTEFLRSLLARHEAPVDQIANVKAGIGAVVGISAVGWLAAMTGLPLLLAPMGATAALLFGQPSSPLAQPMNVMGGFLIGTIVCEAAFNAFPGMWVAAAIAVGVTVALMRGLRVTHPPAGAMPILGFGEQLHGVQLFGVTLVSCVILIALALAVHAIPPRRQYPLRTARVQPSKSQAR
jgi:CBS-domain-containing membrane protein